MTLFNEIRSNLRLRLGLAAIVAIFATYGMLEWRDHNQARLAEYRQLIGQVARLEGQQNQLQWQTRAVEAKAVLSETEKRLWRNTSIGLAQAEFQDWMYALLRQADAKNASVRISDGEVGFEARKLPEDLPADLHGLKPLKAAVEFNTDPQVLLALLAALNDAEHQIVVEVLNVKGFRTDLRLTAWYRIQPVAQDPPAGTAPLAPKSK